MRAYDIIYKKRQGGELTKPEIEFLIQGFVGKKIPDYQMTAWLMAVYFSGMTRQETAWLTQAFIESGDAIDLSEVVGIKVDKHSTGGVGDKTTLVLAPLVAAAGVKVAKLSGRGLGHTGGTIDKLECFPGFKIDWDMKEFVQLVKNTGLGLMASSQNIVPADKAIYALRDVTATVDSLPLIASSIMSKKIASGADAIVLDVKYGDGSFQENARQAHELAKVLVGIGEEMGRKTVAIISNMDQPLGKAVGNALEVKEAINTLKGEGPPDLRELCLQLGVEMLKLAEIEFDATKAQTRLKAILNSGEALDKFRAWVSSQHGDPAMVDKPDLLPQSKIVKVFPANMDGYVQTIKAQSVGLAAMALGAGRESKEDQLDLAAGIVLNKKVGDQVKKGEALAWLHTSQQDKLKAAESTLAVAFSLSREPVNVPPLILGKVDGSELTEIQTFD